eukprot:914176-Amorphochlora_amoeboformis.AAC.2
MSKKDSKKGETAQVNVVIRIRPLNGLEKRTGQVYVLKRTILSTSDVAISGHGLGISPKSSVFDCKTQESANKSIQVFRHVFHRGSSLSTIDDQRAVTKYHQIFEGVGMKMLDGVMNGFHGCIFAYGQTSSGKTFSIHGSQKHPGMVPQ